MATIVEGLVTWKARIRCAHPSFGGRLNRVDGCFALIEITLDDLKGHRDSDGDWTVWTECPGCGQRLYPEWQIGSGPIEVAKERILNAKKGP